MKIVADMHIPFIREYFSPYGELILKPGRAISPADVADADLLLVRSVTRVDQKLLADSRVRFVGSVTAGADHLDTKWLDDNGIDWSVATGFNAPPVADYVVSVIAALQRKRLLGHTPMRAAVIGVGNVGRLVVERLQHLNFEITLCDPVRAEKESDFVSTPMQALSDMDLISLHVPLTKTGAHATHHFINQAFLQQQKTGCVLVNASRGAVIDSHALLTYGKHLRWCLDVWEHEPRIDKALLEQALLATPHIAGYSVQSKIRGIDMIYRIVCEKNLITPLLLSPIAMPHQQLTFAGQAHHWQDLVLGVFNPIIITAMMRELLIPVADYGHCFDEMRNQFNYRHEFGYTHIAGVTVSAADEKVLENLGLKLA